MNITTLLNLCAKASSDGRAKGETPSIYTDLAVSTVASVTSIIIVLIIFAFKASGAIEKGGGWLKRKVTKGKAEDEEDKQVPPLQQILTQNVYIGNQMQELCHSFREFRQTLTPPSSCPTPDRKNAGLTEMMIAPPEPSSID